MSSATEKYQIRKELEDKISSEATEDIRKRLRDLFDTVGSKTVIQNKMVMTGKEVMQKDIHQIAGIMLGVLGMLITLAGL